MTYLRRILEALDHPDMIHLILHYLLALPDDAPTSAASRASVSAARHRKSVDLAAMMASHSELPSTPALFNLVDLIEGNLRSTNQQTISVALQLISVILRRHHRYAVPTLLRTSRLLHDEPRRTMGAHEGQVHLLLALAGELGGQDAIHAMYEDHIHDCTNLLESHPCSVDLIAPSTTTDATPTGVPLSMPGAHTLRLDDPLLELMIGTLQGFFSNAVETNLSLTATIVDLAGCGYMHIDGWLLPDPSSYVYDSPMHDAAVADDDGELAQLALIRRARIAPNLEQTPLPALLATLRTLVSQACAYASTLPRFEGLLQQRREAFSTASAQSPPSHVTSPSRSVSTDLALGRQSPFDALASKLFLDLPSRSKSPRGRRRDDGSSTPGSSTPLPRTMQHRIASSERPPTTIHDSVPISQTLAFAAVDQAILTRKVAVPPPPLQSLPDLAVPPPPPPAQSLPDPDVPEPDTDEPAAASKQPDPTREVSVSHILTNVLVLQDFLLELTALIQVRASLFREVKVV